MREVAFIEQNKDKWLEVEAILNKGQTISPDQMADNYIQLLGDLSFAQTYHPRSNTTIYLNFLVTQIYQKIYKTKRIDKNRLKFFLSKSCLSCRDLLRSWSKLFKKEYSVSTKSDEHFCQKLNISLIFMLKKYPLPA